MAASIWTPGNSVQLNADANSQVKSEEFVAAAGQTSFTLTTFTYAQGTGAIQVFVNGVKQQASEVAETANNIFVLSQACEVDDVVECVAQVALVASVVPNYDPATLAQLAAPTGALLVGIQDSGTYFAGATVEAALQEIGAELGTVAPLADPAFTGTPTKAGSALATLVDVVDYIPHTAKKNILNNGNFSLWQRATSQGSSATYTIGSADRWAFIGNIAGAVTRVSSGMPSREYAARIGRGASGSTVTFGIAQALDNQASRAAINSGSLRLSIVWKRGANFTNDTVTGSNITITTYLGTGTDESLASMVAGTWTAVSAANTDILVSDIESADYELVGLNLLGDSLYSAYTQLGVRIQWESSGASLGADDYLYIASISLVPGVALDLDINDVPYEEPTALRAECERYYRNLIAWVPASTSRYTFPINMRSTPTISGGAAGFTSTGTTAEDLVCYQTAAAQQTLVLNAEL
jgi:hypothetical protein